MGLLKVVFGRKQITAGTVDDMEPQFKAVLRDSAAYINENYEVDALCRSFPERLEAVISARGERFSY